MVIKIINEAKLKPKPRSFKNLKKIFNAYFLIAEVCFFKNRINLI